MSVWVKKGKKFVLPDEVFVDIEREMKPQLVSGGNHMADMLVKLYNIPHSHDTEENLLKS